jgi:hypothetical protein
MFEWIAIFLVIFGVLIGAAWFFRGQLTGQTDRGRDKRIGLTEVVSIDGSRKLMLIYRDGVEHLVMTGGPIDVVVEQNIGQPPQQRRQFDGRVPPNSPPTFGGASSGGGGPSLSTQGGGQGLGQGLGLSNNPGAMVGAGPDGDGASVTGRLRQRVSPPPTLDT